MYVQNRTSRRRAVATLAATALAAPLLMATGTTGATARPAATARAEQAKQTEQQPAQGKKLARKLVGQTSAKGAMKHLRAFQALADTSRGNRAVGTPGHDRSARYAGTLLERAGYDVAYQKFEFTYVEPLAEKLKVLGPDERDVPVNLMTYTASTPEGGIRAALAAVPSDADTGCDAADFAGGDYAGRIALMRRGGCAFADKQAAAADAGAVGVLVYNDTEGALEGTLGDPGAGRVPTGGITRADGKALAAEAARGEVTVSLELRELQQKRTTPNVIAETRGGDPDNVVMLGAHLDSVRDGPGLNDNASGSAGLLETALQLARADGPGNHGRHGNKVRFALWTAEELGLVGSEHYVAGLSEAEREDIALYLNFDMIASPNYGLFVYDGDDSDGVGEGPGPEGSAQLERGINDFLRSRGHEPRGTDFSGRSDYGPFIKAGIPSGGTFTGAEVLKSEKEAALWGGEAGVAYDKCYHSACDDLSSINQAALDINVDVIADAVGKYAWDTTPLERAAPVRPTVRSAGSVGGPHAQHTAS